MTIKRVLILLPIIIFAILLQSFFWVPTYDEQTKGNPARLQEFITASIGDARILNPILNADSASSTIADHVFDGLIDRDENLRFRGRLAESWEIYEEAYLAVNRRAMIDGRQVTGAEMLRDFISGAIDRATAGTEISEMSGNIERIEIVPSVRKREEVDLPGKEKKKLTVHYRLPARLKFTLKEVDQDFFRKMEKILGSRYFSSFKPAEYMETEEPGADLQNIAGDLVRLTGHNPVIIFHLRKGVRFHDGHEFDAGDVEFTYRAIMDPKNLSPRTSDYEPVKSLVVVGSYTVKVIYKRLYSPAFSTWAIGILPEHLLNAEALAREARNAGVEPGKFSMRDSAFNRHPVGTGPFRFREWKSDQYIILDRNEEYWEGAPNYRRYTYRIIPDLLTQEMEFYGGSIDSYGVQPHQVARLKTDPAYQSFSGLSFGYTYIGYNMRRPLFRDRRIRRALGMAIDVDRIIKYVMYDQAERITGPFVKQTDYYDRNIKPLPYDPDGALRLLKEAGWERNADGWLEKDGKRFAFTLITNSGNDIRKSILAIAQDSWRKIGIDVRTDIVEWTVFIGKHVNTGNFDALILGWSMGIDPDLYQIWHSSQSGPNQLNFAGFKNEEADDLIVKIRQEYDHDRQVEYCHRLHRIIADEQPYTFLYVGKWTAVLDKKIVIKERLPSGEEVIRRIKPTKTGNYTFYFNKWIKLAQNPVFEME